MTTTIAEIKETVLPLEQISNRYVMLSDKELNKSLAEGCCVHLPRTGGEWTGEPGDSTWKPNREEVPTDHNKSNPMGKTWDEILDEYGIDGINFIDGEPDFSEVSKGTVEIDDFTEVRFGAGANFDQASEKLAEQRGCSKQEVVDWMKENNYTWHERCDCKTMDKVPREVHSNIPHSGGISKVKNNSL